MNSEFIKERELKNDNRHVYLYHLVEEHSIWIAYGYSAYSLKLFAMSHGVEYVRGYSSNVALPYTIVTREGMKRLRTSLPVIQEEENCLYIDMKKSFSEKDFLCWLESCCSEGKKQETIEIKTLVSDLVPKDEFIPDSMSSFARNFKRITDCIVALVTMIVFSPLALCCYIAIKFEDGGPAIFKQERIGRFGRPFNIYKFRSMRLDAEKLGPQLSHSGGDNDPRLTKVGKFIRAHHLDELPQLWNVFCGDMAFIGPRPERKFFIDQILDYDTRYVYLYQIRPGVTSFATLYNGYTDTMEKMLCRLEYDLYYLKKRSWWFDMKILFGTFWSIVGCKKF